jgi:hypothetical protein
MIRLRIAAHIAWLVTILTATALQAGSGVYYILPAAPAVKPTSGLQMTIDGRGIDANGYRPIRIKVAPLPPGPFPADRQLRVVIYPGEYAQQSFPKVSQIIELPEGATSAETTIAVPQTTQWYQFSLETHEGGEKLKDLSYEYLPWNSTGYWQWTEASPAILLIDDRVPPRNQRDNLVGTLQAQGTDPAPTFELPDIRTLVWIFPDPNRGNTWGGGAIPTFSPGSARVSDTTLMMQIQTQMGRIDMVPIAELHKRWIDLSQFDVTIISADDLKRLTADAERLRAIQEWVRSGRTLLVYGAEDEFQRLAEIEKHLALSPLAPDPEESENYRGWKLPDANRYDQPLQTTWDNLRNPNGPYYNMQPYTGSYDPSEPAPFTGGRRAAPTKPPFLLRPAGLGTVVAIASDEPFPGAQEDWHWIFNCVPNNQWSWYQRHGMSLYRQNDDYWSFLIPGVGQAPVISFLLLVSLFAAIIGPVNYILLGRVRRLYLLLITVPAGAGVVTLALFGYAVLTDGLGVRMRVRSFTDLDQATGQAAGFARQSYYASIAPSRGLEFPEDCTVFGLAFEPINGNAQQTTRGDVMVWDDQQKLQSGYITSRTTVQYMVLRSAKSPARLTVREPGGPPQVVNTLGTGIRYLLLRDRRGDYYTAANLANGKSATLTAADLKTAVEEFDRLRELVLPKPPENYDPGSDRESVINFLMPNYNYWGGIDAGSNRPIMAASILERNIALAFNPARHPYQPGTYIAVLESSPFVPAGVPNPREEASLHVLRGKW